MPTGAIIPIAYKLVISYPLGNQLMMQYLILTQYLLRVALAR